MKFVATNVFQMNVWPGAWESVCILLFASLVWGPSAAAHSSPGIVCTKDGTIYFIIGPAHQLWKLNADGKATLLITGGLDQEFRVPHHLTLDAQDNLYTASDAGSYIWKISPAGVREKIYPPTHNGIFPTVGLGGDPFALTADGNIITIDEAGEGFIRLLRVTPEGHAQVLVDGQQDERDDGGTVALLQSLHSSVFAWGPNETLYFADAGKVIYRVSKNGEVETIFDARSVEADTSLDGPKIQYIIGIVVDHSGTVFAADALGNRIWSIDSQGVAKVLAGTGERGADDGPAMEATFDEPVGIAQRDDGALIVLEQTFNDRKFGARVRLVYKGQVQTLAVVIVGSDQVEAVSQ